MKLLASLPATTVHADCDLPCGVYDPAQARIEALSVMAVMTKYDQLHDEDKIRAIIIKEQRADLAEKKIVP